MEHINRITDTLKKKRRLAIIIYIILLLASLMLVESLINNKRDRLESEMTELLKRPFNSIKGDGSVEALNHKSVGNVECVEVPIPPFPENDSKWKKSYWTNKFSGVEHLYKITNGGWNMLGKTYGVFPKDESYVGAVGIQDYEYEPYMICVPYGTEFNSEIAQSLIDESLKRVYHKTGKYDEALNALSQSNEYYKIGGYLFPIESKPELRMCFREDQTGTDPIYENGKFTGYYWFGMISIGTYRVLLGYKNKTVWYIEEKGGFEASLKDRVLYYSLAFLILTSILTLYLFRLKRKQKASNLILTESLKDRILRYADPANFLNSSQPKKVAIARDIFDRTLNTTEDSQVEELADELKGKLDVNLITEQEKAYLINLCSSIVNKNNNQIEAKKVVNDLYVLLADLNNVKGNDYSTIQKTVFRILGTDR